EGKDIEREEALKKIVTVEIDNSEQQRHHHSRSSISVKGIGDIAVRFSKCCSPVPGDEIVGFVTRGRGVSIHRTDCVNIINLDDLERHRIIDAEWKLPEKATEGVSFRADIKVVGDDRLGILVEVSKVFTDEKIDVKTLNARTVKDEAIINVGIIIKSKDELDRIMQKLMNIKSVHEVERVTT
ncbi:MAG: DUF5913 domain-containing protein, partial [Clostridiales bacterium]|nr:DUF5913 domain-containing protein [Clostridiales bacterium]